MKRIFTTLIVFLLIGQCFSQSLNDSLLLYFPFDGNANDYSGNNFHGIVNATLTNDRNGNINQAYSFNGIDQYIDLTDTSKLKPELPISISFWVKFDDLDPTNSTIFTTDFEQNNHSGVMMGLSSTGLLGLSYGDASGNTSSANRRTKTGTTQIAVDTWYHIVGVINGPTDMEIYINCVNDGGTYSGTGGDIGYTTNPGSIGRSDAHSALDAYHFKGDLDDFRYWNRSLNENDINALCSYSYCTEVDTIQVFDTTHVVVYDTTYVTVYDTQYVSVTDTLFIDVLLSAGVNPVSNIIKVYPNPTNDIVIIDNGDYTNMTNYTLKIVNSLGQEVFNSYVSQDQFEIQVSSLGSVGTYFIQVLDSNSNIVDIRKLILH